MPEHLLELTYEQFCHKNKSLENSTIDKYYIYERIGKGGYGSIYRGMDDQTKKEVAVKVLDLAIIQFTEPNPKVREIRRRLAATESEMMVRCDSAHVMKCYDVYQNKDLKIMMIEFCNGGTLYDQMKEKERRFSEGEVVDIVKQVIFGVAEMHKNNILHRDLKPENIMFHNGVLKIVDLGFSKVLPIAEGEEVAFGTVLGTIITMAPEVMRKKKYGLKADIWSIGIIIYELTYGVLPYEPMKAVDMYEQILSKDIFANQGKIKGIKPSKGIIDLMKRLLVVDQDERMNWKQLLDYPLLNEHPETLPSLFRVSRNLNEIKQKGYEDPKERTDEEYLKESFNTSQIIIAGEKKKKVEWISPFATEIKRKEISNEDAKVRNWVEEQHLECLKTEFIFKAIFLPIEEKKCLDLSERRNMEFMYLLISRCFFNMSFINEEVKHANHELVQSLKENVAVLYKAIVKKFQSYCSKLKKIEDRLRSRIEDRFDKIFNSADIKEKDIFLVGVEFTDFTKEEQIQYTCGKYLPMILEKELNPKEIKLQQYLNKYNAINLISLQQLKHKTFQERIQEMIKH